MSPPHIIVTCSAAHSCHAQQALCQRSSQDSGEVYTPNIPDFYFTPANAADFLTSSLTETVHGTAYIFTIPAVGPERNCSGMVTSLQFCYRTNRSGTMNIFDFLVLRNDSTTLTVVDRIPVRTNPKGCVTNICCTGEDLPRNHNFIVPITEINIGVVVSYTNARPLVFRPTATEYNVPQYILSTAPGITFTPSPQEFVTDNSLILLRFFLGKIWRDQDWVDLYTTFLNLA